MKDYGVRRENNDGVHQGGQGVVTSGERNHPGIRRVCSANTVHRRRVDVRNAARDGSLRRRLRVGCWMMSTGGEHDDETAKLPDHTTSQQAPNGWRLSCG